MNGSMDEEINKEKNYMSTKIRLNAIEFTLDLRQMKITEVIIIKVDNNNNNTDNNIITKIRYFIPTHLLLNKVRIQSI